MQQNNLNLNLTADNVELTPEQQAKAEAKARREAAKKAREQAEANKPAFAGSHEGNGAHILPEGRYIISYAQNNTEPNNAFLDLLHFASLEIGADFLLGASIYNRSAFLKLDDSRVYWHDKVKANLLDMTRDYIIGDRVKVASTAGVLPTAVYPLSGFAGYSENRYHVIVPHTKQDMEVLPALKGECFRNMYSTGAVTLKNYIPKRAGAIAEKAHIMGALYVSVRNGEAFISQIQFDGNGFYLLSEGCYIAYFGHDESGQTFVEGATGKAVESLILGDIHAEHITASRLTDLAALVSDFNPDSLVLHDVCDFSSRNHHNIKNAHFLHSMLGRSVKNDIKRIKTVLEGLRAVMPGHGKIHIVESNHDLALEKWLHSTDWRDDVTNAEIYLRLNLAMLQNQKDPEFNLLAHALFKRAKPEAYNFLVTDQSLRIHGIELGNHGHNGANGAKGSPKGFTKLGTPLVTGHTHTPSIYGDVFTVGVSAGLEMGYNVGPSSWRIAHCVIFRNGKRAIYME